MAGFSGAGEQAAAILGIAAFSAPTPAAAGSASRLHTNGPREPLSTCRKRFAKARRMPRVAALQLCALITEDADPTERNATAHCSSDRADRGSRYHAGRASVALGIIAQWARNGCNLA